MTFFFIVFIINFFGNKRIFIRAKENIQKLTELHNKPIWKRVKKSKL